MGKIQGKIQCDDVLVTVINCLPAEVVLPQNHSLTRALFKIPLKTYLFLPEEKEAATETWFIRFQMSFVFSLCK